MQRPPSEDVPLFSTRSLEGEYTAWALVWTRDYGVGVFLDEVLVDNYGTVYTEDLAIPAAYSRTFLGVETNTLTYTYYLWTANRARSASGKYVLGTPLALNREFQVWRDGAMIFSRDLQLDEATVASIYLVDISPNGKFVACIATKLVTFDDQLLLLYEGT